jgi:hypothetical protein
MSLENYSSENSGHEIPDIPEFGIPDFSELQEEPRSNDLPLGEGVYTFNKDCIVGQIEVRGETRNVKTIHEYRGEVYLGEHPVPEWQADIDSKLPELETMMERQSEMLESLPDRNDEHQEVIDRAREITGMSDTKVKILDEKTYEFVTGSGTANSYRSDHLLVKENNIFGLLPTVVEGLNYSDGQEPKDVPLFTIQNPETGKMNYHALMHTGELTEWALGHDGTMKLRNSYFDEVSVHAKSLKQLADAGELDLSEANMEDFVMQYDEGQSTISLPKNIGGQIPLHGLTLLEKLSPGLINDLEQSRNDHSHFQSVINRINDIDALQNDSTRQEEPGLLYENLRDLGNGNITDNTLLIYSLGLKGQNLLDIRDIKNSIYDLGVAPD